MTTRDSISSLSSIIYSEMSQGTYVVNIFYLKFAFALLLFCLFDLILYVPSTIFQLYRDGSSWVEPVLS